MFEITALGLVLYLIGSACYAETAEEMDAVLTRFSAVGLIAMGIIWLAPEGIRQPYDQAFLAISQWIVLR